MSSCTLSPYPQVPLAMPYWSGRLLTPASERGPTAPALPRETPDTWLEMHCPRLQARAWGLEVHTWGGWPDVCSGA